MEWGNIVLQSTTTPKMFPLAREIFFQSRLANCRNGLRDEKIVR